MNDYKRITPTDTTVLINEFTQPLGESKAMQYALRLKEFEDKIESGELVTKEEHQRVCRLLYQQGRFDEIADRIFKEENKK